MQFQPPPSPRPGQYQPDQQYSQWSQQPPSSPQPGTAYPQQQLPSQPLAQQPLSRTPQPYQPPSQPLQSQSQPTPVKPPARKSPRKPWKPWQFVLFGLIVGAIMGYAIHTPPAASSTPTDSTAQTTTTQATTQPTSHPTKQPTQAPTKAPVTRTPVHTFLTFGDGMLQVGKDIQPGTYRTRVGSAGCYYARLKAFDTNAIISNDNTDAPAVVTILATDKAFQSQNCGTWTNDLSAITSSKTSFGDGIFIVGTDMAPGTYRNTTSPGCYYARLSAFDTNAIISNDNTDAVAIVTIAASDKGFQSRNCGTWTKQ